MYDGGEEWVLLEMDEEGFREGKEGVLERKGREECDVGGENN